jgi:hypothetical protein
MLTTTVRPDGSIALGESAEAVGFAPGRVVNVIMSSSGALIIALDESPPALDVDFRPLVGGAAQLASRRARATLAVDAVAPDPPEVT